MLDLLLLLDVVVQITSKNVPQNAAPQRIKGTPLIWSAITCSKFTIGTLEQEVTFVQSLK